MLVFEVVKSRWRRLEAEEEKNRTILSVLQALQASDFGSIEDAKGLASRSVDWG